MVLPTRSPGITCGQPVGQESIRAPAAGQVLTNQVTVISNASLAYGSSTNFLALADGQIYRALPTVPGTTYTLSFAYRGPGAVGLWRAESNATDVISGGTGTVYPGTTYPPGEVGQALVSMVSTAVS